MYEETDPARAVELMELRVTFEREIGHVEAEEHAAQMEEVRSSIPRS